MNEISILFKYLTETFLSNDLVNNVSYVHTSEFQMNKETLYPIVNMDIISSNVSFPDMDSITVDYLITICSERDIKPEVEDNKLLINTNMHDNFNECHTIATEFLMQLNRTHNDYNISVVAVTAISFLRVSGLEGVDGVQFQVTLQIPNKSLAC